MRRAELEHVLRAASQALGLREFVVIGSASILATYPESALPDAATRSDEADLAVFDDPVGDVATRIDGAIGELSPFHATHGYYGQGVEVTTARLSDGWQLRLVRYRNRNTGRGVGWCLDRHDCVASKLIAFRDKDREFAAALFAAGLVDPGITRQRVDRTTGVEPRAKARTLAWIDAYLTGARQRQTTPP